jgi:transcriptional regulator with XRE-family HTH domain
MNNIGMIIRKLRKARGLTQIQLANKIGATQKVVTSYETNQATPTLENLIKIADVFQISIDELVGRKKAGNPDVIAKNDYHIHGNSRSAKMQEIFEKLTSLEQWAILRQATALVKDHN